MHLPLAMVGLGAAELLILLFILPCLLGALAFWAWMIVDCANSTDRPTEKIVWMLVILFGGPIGAPLYFFARKLARPSPAGSHRPLGAPS